MFEIANERYYDIVGRRDLIGRTVREALPEVEGQGFFELLDGVYRTGESFAGDEMPVLLRRGKDDSLQQRYMNLVYQPMRDADGRVGGIFVHGVDVTELVLAREAARGGEAQLRLMADAMPQIVWVTRPDGYHDYYNRRWYEYLGLDFERTKGDGWADPLHPDDRERARAAGRTALATGEDYEIEYRFRRHDGAYRWFLGRAAPVRDADGKVVRWYGTCTDIDEQKRLRDEREQVLEGERAAGAGGSRAGRGRGGEPGEGPSPRVPRPRATRAADAGLDGRVGDGGGRGAARGPPRGRRDDPPEHRTDHPPRGRPARRQPGRARQTRTPRRADRRPRDAAGGHEDVRGRRRGEGGAARPRPAGHTARRRGRRPQAHAGLDEPLDERH